VQSCLERLIPLADTRNVSLTADSDLAVPQLLIDSDRIAQVLVILLDNAIKFSRPGGTVMVKITTRPDKLILVQVCDSGSGIPAADLPRIGQRFYRVDKARTRSEGGSGLGLAIAQALVSAHGGHLWLESTEGQGTTASFTLPVAS
jgi:signal transduction histidine kinase